MIGSEGTLGFVSRATYNTVPEWPHKASAFVVFPDVRSACRAAAVLRRETAVDAVELFDRPSLRECEADEAMTRLVPDIVGCDPMAAALLIECRGRDERALEESCDEVRRALKRHDLPLGGRADAPRSLDVQDVLGRAQGADPHRGRRPGAGDVDADRGRRVPRRPPRRHDGRPRRDV